MAYGRATLERSRFQRANDIDARRMELAGILEEEKQEAQQAHRKEFEAAYREVLARLNEAASAYAEVIQLYDLSLALWPRDETLKRYRPLPSGILSSDGKRSLSGYLVDMLESASSKTFDHKARKFYPVLTWNSD
jgi:hypothetical protein